MNHLRLLIADENMDFAKKMKEEDILYYRNRPCVAGFQLLRCYA